MDNLTVFQDRPMYKTVVMTCRGTCNQIVHLIGFTLYHIVHDPNRSIWNLLSFTQYYFFD